MTVSVDRLIALRKCLNTHHLDAVIIPRSDAFCGEEVQPADERLAWISGFTGSAGLAVVTPDYAALFSDGRYRLQMTDQTDSQWQCHVTPGESVTDWLLKHIGDDNGGKIGFDPMLMTVSAHERLNQELATKGNSRLSLVPTTENLIDAIWQDKPVPHISSAWNVDKAYHGCERRDKIAAVTDQMASAGADCLLISDPTELAWLLNIRASDLENTPVMLAFAIISALGDITIFHDPKALAEVSKAHITIRPAKDLMPSLQQYHGQTVWVDPAHCPFGISDSLSNAGAKLLSKPGPITPLKAIKNTVEADGFRSAHQRDAVAMIRFLAWLDDAASDGHLTEMAAAKKLQSFRRQVSGYLGDSFGTISAYGEHGAIVHYRATERTNALLAPNSLYLVDSGGQYHDATTDITRTVFIGQTINNAPEEAAFCYTSVLKAHIALDQQSFPQGITGVQLDAIARQPLWNVGLDFAHGTGHGVGCCLSVHEGPANISPRGQVKIEAGMVLSNEPGYYRDGAFGIRLENLLLVIANDDDTKSDLGFEHLTLVPFDRRLIRVDLLSDDEWQWVNRYHHEVKENIAPLIAKIDDRAERDHVLAWLNAATAPISKK